MSFAMHFQEKKLVAEIKQTAKTGNEASLLNVLCSYEMDNGCR
jgi:hypothetical protein